MILIRKNDSNVLSEKNGLNFPAVFAQNLVKLKPRILGNPSVFSLCGNKNGVDIKFMNSFYSLFISMDMNFYVLR